MSGEGSVVVVGGTRAIGLEIVKHYARAGRDVVITGQAAENVQAAVADAASLGSGKVSGVAFDLSSPTDIASALAGLGPVRHLVLAAIARDTNKVDEYDIVAAIRLITIKLVGYTEVIHALRGRLGDESSIVLFGGMAKERPYPGSTTVSTVNGGVVGLTRTLVQELRPIRINSIHPGKVSDSPYWIGKAAPLEADRLKTPTGRLATMDDIVGAVAFLLENRAANGIELLIDGGLHCL